MKEKIKNFYEKHKNIFLFMQVSIRIVFLLIIIYFVERYIIYNIIHYITNLLLIIFNFKDKGFFSLKFEIILLDIYFHIILSRIIILSIIFPQGGLFKRFVLMDEFIEFTGFISTYALKAIKNIKSNDNNELELNINKLNKLSLKNNIKIKNNNYFRIEEHLNNISKSYNKYKSNNALLNERKNLIEALQNLSDKLIEIKDISFKGFLFNFKYRESLFYMENYLLNYFSDYIAEKINIYKDFDIYLFSPIKMIKYNNILLIFCNQNDICCEFYPVIPDNIYHYITNLKCTIIIWNYRGSGLRKGFTTFGNIDKDVNILSNYIKNNFNKYKIIVHGISIGGYASIRLTQKLSSCVDNVVLICDRTFSDIKDIVQTITFGKILFIIYNIIFPKFFFKYRNVENYISLPFDKKLILFDAKDNIINYKPSSLVYVLTKKYFIEVVKPFLSKYNEYYILNQNYKALILDLFRLNTRIEKGSDKVSDIFISRLYKNIINNSFEEFVMFFIIFGYPFNKHKEISSNNIKLKENFINIPCLIKDILEDNKDVFRNELKEFISIMNFLFIKFNLNCYLNKNDIFQSNYNCRDRNNIFNMEQKHINELKKYLGCNFRIFCGHIGTLEDKDFDIIKDFLKNNKYI